MQDYVSQIFDSFKLKIENVQSHQKLGARKRVKFENDNKHAIHKILHNLDDLKQDFEQRILTPARALSMNPHTLDAGDDELNPHLSAVYAIEDAIASLKEQLLVQLSDPIKDEEDFGPDDVGADAPLNQSELPSDDSAPDNAENNSDAEEQALESQVKKTAESYEYYRGLHPEKDDLLKLNGWTYSGNEIWDDLGICSIVYEPREDKIFVFELLDENGVDQNLIATCDSVEELDDALANFVELEDIAPEMKEAFKEYVENQRSNQNEAIQQPEEDAELEEKPEPIIIDEWEYLASDPDYGNNSTLLYDKGGFVVFIQKDLQPENELPYLAMTAGFNDGDQSHQDSSIDNLCKWLEINEYPVPTEDAKIALTGSTEELMGESNTKEKENEPKDFVKKIPAGMKRVQDDPSTTTLAKIVEEPKIAKIEEPKK